MDDDTIKNTSNGDQPENDAVVPEMTELEKCQKEKDEYLQGWQRAKADFANYKKDEVKRLEEFARYQAEGMVREFLTVMDSFDLAINALTQKGPVDKGIYLIRSQMEDLLRRKGVVKIPISPGSPFDPAVAEAIVEEESDLPEGSVVEEIESGYKMGEKVVRPARVKIAKPKQGQ